MRIAVMGAGALGGYFGGRLAAAGQDVTLIARGAHLAAIQAEGLRIVSPKGDLHLPDIAATDDPASIGPVDIVLFMVKNYDVADAGRAIAPLLTADTMVVPVQNGVTAHERLAGIIGAERVVPGVARTPADVMAPGVVRLAQALDRLTIGEATGGGSPRCQRLHDALKAAGTSPAIADNIIHDMWAKLVMQAAFASFTALLRLDFGPIRSTPATTDLFRAAMAETARVGEAVVPDLPRGLEVTVWDRMAGLGDSVHASMLDDLARGKRIEVDYLGGEVVRLGKLHGVPTPIHTTFHAALQPFLNGAPPAPNLA